MSGYYNTMGQWVPSPVSPLSDADVERIARAVVRMMREERGDAMPRINLPGVATDSNGERWIFNGADWVKP